MLVDEHHDVAELESSLPPSCAVVIEPTSVRITADGGGADSEDSAGFFEAELGVEEAFDHLLAGLFKLADVVVGGDFVIKHGAEERDGLGELLKNLGEPRIEVAVVLSYSRPWSPHFGLLVLPCSFLLSAQVRGNLRQIRFFVLQTIQKGVFDVRVGV